MRNGQLSKKRGKVEDEDKGRGSEGGLDSMNAPPPRGGRARDLRVDGRQKTVSVLKEKNTSEPLGSLASLGLLFVKHLIIARLCELSASAKRCGQTAQEDDISDLPLFLAA